jgi:cytoskeletal protein CcmA (bactofilin family)
MQTVLPSRREVACCHCGWETHVLGQALFAVCVKCHERFDLIDYTLGTACAPTLRTGGTVRITPEAVISGGDIRATSVILEGRIVSGRLEAFRELDIRSSAVIEDESGLFFRDLIIGPDTSLRLTSRVACRDLTLAGRLEADVCATGRIVMASGGMHTGRLEGASLRMEDGAGLWGPVVIQTPDADA